MPATFFCSIRSRYDQGHASRPPSARMDAPRARGEMRPSLEGTSPPPWNELSLWHAIEMQPSVPSCIAPMLICHSVSWPRQPHTVTHKKKGARHPERRWERLAQQRILAAGLPVRCVAACAVVGLQHQSSARSRHSPCYRSSCQALCGPSSGISISPSAQGCPHI